MKTFDDLYMELGTKLLKEGKQQEDIESVRAVYADGEKAITKSIEGVSFEVTPDMGVPILTSKRVPVKSPLIELQWIWQEMSNKVSWLKERNVHIWDEWERPDGTIGKAYGWQLANKTRNIPLEIANWDNCDTSLNQVEYMLHELVHSPSSRRIMTTLWDVDDLDDMALEPCVWSTHWTVYGGKLNLHVKQRSADFCLGLPFNVYQYHVLHAYVAKFVGLELGTMHWNIDNMHVYERHIPTLEEQFTKYMVDLISTKIVDPKMKAQFGIQDVVTLNIPEDFDMSNFFKNKLSDATLSGYKPLASYKYEIAI